MNVEVKETKEGRKVLRIDESKCTGCISCVITCSFAHTQRFSMNAKINIKKDKPEGICEIKVCRQCEDAPCVDACPVAALERNPETGLVMFFAENCIGCKQCSEACPYDAVFFNEEKNLIEKCDLCGGEPMCAKVCTTGAISIEGGENI
jgi:anaerobic carbon-monoxide dehydrogenase iron sulfur subunit